MIKYKGTYDESALSNFLQYLRKTESSFVKVLNEPLVPLKVPSLNLEIDNRTKMDEMILETRTQFKTILSQLDQGDNRQRVNSKIATLVDGKFNEFLIAPEYDPEWIKENTRKIFYDIETQYFPSDIEGVYDRNNPKPLQKVAASISIDDEGNVKFWDHHNAKDLFLHLLEYDEVVGFNSYVHDNQVLSAYAPYSGSVQALYNKSFDLMRHMAFRDPGWKQDSNYNLRNLDSYAGHYCGDSKLKNQTINKSKSIIELIRNGSSEERAWVWKYCFKDVQLLLGLYKKFNISMMRKAKFYRQQVIDIENIVKKALEDKID